MAKAEEADTGFATYEFKKKLEELRTVHGRATELISLYVPPGKLLSDVAGYLRDEYAQSSNIKSQSTRKNVMAAISSILSRLKQYKAAPPNGVVFFVGHKSIAGDQTDMVALTVEPPDPVASFLYRCDSEFFLEPLEYMLKEKDCYGLIVVDRGGAAVGFLRGRKIDCVSCINSQVPRKHGRGGQSQRRFERLIEESAHAFFVKVGNITTNSFLPEIDNIKAILIGGPGATKKYFVEEGHIHHELLKKPIEYFDTGYTDESGLKELVERASDMLSNLDLMKEKKLLQRFMQEVIKSERGLSAYGEQEIRYALGLGAVDTLLISEAVRKTRAIIKCDACGNVEERTYQGELKLGKCQKCGGVTKIESEQDIVKELIDAAQASNGKVQIISIDTDEGKMLLNAFGGLAAMLRFPVRG